MSTTNLVNQLSSDFPTISFILSDRFWWSPQNKSIFYNSFAISKPHGQWTLLHEVGHALSDHQHYGHDIELIEMEMQAWAKANQIASDYDIQINNNHIQNCLDTYRDWLHLRSTCPKCHSVGIQEDKKTYYCYNCHNSWIVSETRFCRPYRTLKKSPQN